VIGPWALVQSMLPLLTAAPAARVVNVSSLSSQQVATGLDLGAHIFRVHDVAAAKDFITVRRALRGEGELPTISGLPERLRAEQPHERVS